MYAFLVAFSIFSAAMILLLGIGGLRADNFATMCLLFGVIIAAWRIGDILEARFRQ